MRVLVVGGSGYVGRLVLPALTQAHQVRVLDLRPPPAGTPCAYLPGDATDPSVLATGCAGTDAVVHMAMAPMRDHRPLSLETVFDVHVKSVYLALTAAARAGMRHAVHISSLSVFGQLGRRPIGPDDEPDATHPYGLSKRLGEQAARAVAVEHGLALTILRLAWPTPDRAWPYWAIDPDNPRRYRMADGTEVTALAGTDLARALLAALDRPDGIRALPVAGDLAGVAVDLSPTRAALDWWPSFGTGD